jgi:hypothetical protein
MRSTIQPLFMPRRWLPVLAMTISSFASAQSNTATITGTVTDGTGAVIPKTEIVLEVTNGTVLRTITDTEGHFALETEPGEYVLKISSPDPRMVRYSSHIRLTAATPVNQNVKLYVTGDYGPVIEWRPPIELLNASVASTLPLRPLPPLKLHARKPTSLR